VNWALAVGGCRLSKVQTLLASCFVLRASCALPAPISLVSTTKQITAHEIIFGSGCLLFLCRRPRRRGRLLPHGTGIYPSRSKGRAKGIVIQGCSPALSFRHVVCHVVLGAEDHQIPNRERPLFMSFGFKEIENALSLASNCCQCRRQSGDRPLRNLPAMCNLPSCRSCYAR